MFRRRRAEVRRSQVPTAFEGTVDAAGGDGEDRLTVLDLFDRVGGLFRGLWGGLFPE